MTRAAGIMDIPVPADGGLRVRATADARWDARSYLLGDPEDTSTIGPRRVGGPFGLWEAELELLTGDYDGGTQALVRFATIGRAIIPGSQLYGLDGRPWTAGASTCCSTAPRT